MFKYELLVVLLFSIIYNQIKIRNVKILRSFLIIIHSLLIVLSIYPILFHSDWNEDLWICCVTGEIVLIFFTIIFYPYDLRANGIYEAINSNNMITFLGPMPFTKKGINLEEINNLFNLIFSCGKEYRIPSNIVIIGSYANNIINLTFIFWRKDDYDIFINNTIDLKAQQVVTEYKRGILIEMRLQIA